MFFYLIIRSIGMERQAIPWFEYTDDTGHDVFVDMYIEKYGTGKLPRKYERALERFFHTKDKKVMLQKAMKSRLAPVMKPNGTVELVEHEPMFGDFDMKKVADRIARRFIASTEDENRLKSMKQWTTGDGTEFRPAGNTMPKLPPGYYECNFSPMCGYFLSNIPCNTEDLIRFPETSVSSVVNEIKKFWTKEAEFRRAGLAFKRGLLMFGPPGTGKSCTIKLAISDVYERGGVAIKMEDPEVFLECVRIFRAIQPTTPLVVIMEDIDSLLERFSQTSILNLLDGVEGLEWTVFLATTNYPEKLGSRIINRPSRFDRRFEVPALGAKSRAIYLQHLLAKYRPDRDDINLRQWVEDTDGMSISHLKELFVGVLILEDDYEEVMGMLREMQDDKPTSGENDTSAHIEPGCDAPQETAPSPCCGTSYYGSLKMAASQIL